MRQTRKADSQTHPRKASLLYLIFFCNNKEKERKRCETLTRDREYNDFALRQIHIDTEINTQTESKKEDPILLI